MPVVCSSCSSVGFLHFATILKPCGPSYSHAIALTKCGPNLL